MALISNEETMERQLLHEAKFNYANLMYITALFNKQLQKKSYLNKSLYSCEILTRDFFSQGNIP
jgi:hypothetical protein